MRRLIDQTKKIWLRRVVTAFLIGLTFLVTAIGQLGLANSAQAAAATPEAKAYQADGTTQTPATEQAKDADAGGGVIDNIREKLNLDEPLPESTKLFLKQVQGEDVEVSEPRPSGKSGQPMN